MQQHVPAWIRKEFEHPNFANETVAWFRHYFRHEAPEPNGLRIFSRADQQTGQTSLLMRMPWPLGEEHAEWMVGWEPANDAAADLAGWHQEI
jgi:hypothetical protein